MNKDKPMPQIPDKESVDAGISLIETYPIAGAVLSAVAGSCATYLGFMKGVISIPSTTAKLASQETELINQAERIDLLVASNTKLKEREEKHRLAMEQELADLKKQLNQK